MSRGTVDGHSLQQFRVGVVEADLLSEVVGQNGQCFLVCRRQSTSQDVERHQFLTVVPKQRNHCHAAEAGIGTVCVESDVQHSLNYLRGVL